MTSAVEELRHVVFVISGELVGEASNGGICFNPISSGKIPIAHSPTLGHKTECNDAVPIERSAGAW